MCGILLAIQRREDVTTGFESHWEQLKLSVSARGPDAQDIYQTVVTTDDGSFLDVRFFASELRLRGDKPVVQPHRDSGNVFCWNGEVFEGLEIDASENDGAKLFKSIRTSSDPGGKLTEVLQQIEGPQVFTCLRRKATETKRLYYGRDPLGRRSLLVHRPTQQNPIFLLASYQLEEVDTEHLHCLYLNEWYLKGKFKSLFVSIHKEFDAAHVLHVLPRFEVGSRSNDFVSPSKVNGLIPHTPPMSSSLSVIPEELSSTVDDLIAHLSRSVYLRVRDIPYQGREGQARVAILFSGGIDSTMLAYMADRHLPLEEPIDLLNVAFENPRKIQIRAESKNTKKNRRNRERNPVPQDDGQEKIKFDSYLVPDRVTGFEELVELKKLCPQRQWNFVEVDVTFEETTKYRPIVESLMFPCRTVMDLVALALALYFASRGIGHVRTSSDGQRAPYTSNARVVLNGLGSDELLGGYGRHRTAFNAGGWPSVIDELQLEIDRIPTRNLGRDDRIISSHGKEARHPFLSLFVVNFLARLPVHHKTDPRIPLGIGDKMLLRLAARKVGLELASGRKKRAMQFGSHSARMEAGESERRGDILLAAASPGQL
ncbi:asparagine synthase-domain-containing protein [Phellopilus nigrolimitatus]|nr:asparagine synthase-domain-containing protein [Phellopilus nigrolimitatus]